jgi:hypothetical protein
VPLADGVACADKWLSLSDPGQLFVVGAAMRSRGELALADELERKRANTGGGPDRAPVFKYTPADHLPGCPN